jgi:hypothetical protein
MFLSLEAGLDFEWKSCEEVKCWSGRLKVENIPNRYRNNIDPSNP